MVQLYLYAYSVNLDLTYIWHTLSIHKIYTTSENSWVFSSLKELNGTETVAVTMVLLCKAVLLRSKDGNQQKAHLICTTVYQAQ